MHQLPAVASEQATATRENFVERFLKVRRVLGHIPSNLFDVLLIALLDLLAKELTQRTVAKAFVALLGMIRHQIGHERPRKSTRALTGVGSKERINWTLPRCRCRHPRR